MAIVQSPVERLGAGHLDWGRGGGVGVDDESFRGYLGMNKHRKRFVSSRIPYHKADVTFYFF